MDEYKEHLRRLAVHDEAFLGVILAEDNTLCAAVLDERTAALVRVAATIAVMRSLPPSSTRWRSPSLPGQRETRSSQPSRR